MRKPDNLSEKFHDLLDPGDPNTPPSDFGPVNPDEQRPPSRDYIPDPVQRTLQMNEDERRMAEIRAEIRAAPAPGQGPPSRDEMILRVLDAIGEMVGHGFSDQQVSTLRTCFRNDLIQTGMPFHDADAGKADDRLRKALERARKARPAGEPR